MRLRSEARPAVVGLSIATICAVAGFVLTELIIRRTAVWRLDEAIAAAVPTSRIPALTAVMQPLTHVGDTLVAVALTAIAGFALLLWARRESGVVLLVAAASSAVTVEVVKRFGNRARPPSQFAIANLPDPYSFPSGHSAATMLLACLLGYLALRHLRRSVAVPLAVFGVVLAASVGVSRVYLGVHWPADVLGGWLVAWAWSALAIGTLRTLERVRAVKTAAEPDVTPGGSSA